jgi:hypothetical protein
MHAMIRDNREWIWTSKSFPGVGGQWEAVCVKNNEDEATFKQPDRNRSRFTFYDSRRRGK